MNGQTMPAGEIVKLMERGQITIPAKYREELGLTPNTPLNVFQWRGMVVVAPINLTPRFSKVKGKTADWTKDSPQKYLNKVRYSALETLWTQMAKSK